MKFRTIIVEWDLDKKPILLIRKDDIERENNKTFPIPELMVYHSPIVEDEDTAVNKLIDSILDKDNKLINSICSKGKKLKGLKR